MILTPAHTSDNSSSGLSMGVWRTCPIEEYALYRRGGFYFFDDFHKIPNLASNTEEDGYWAYLDTNCTAGPAASTVPASPTFGGVLSLTTGTVDNSEGVFGWAGSNSTGRPVVQIAPTGAVTRKLWFEARIATSSVTTLDLFVGLAAIGSIATEKLFSDTSVSEHVSTECVGFQFNEADSDTLAAVYGTTTRLFATTSAIATAVVNTWYKLGLYYDGAKMHWFVNGVDVYPAGIAYNATGFPDAVSLCPVLNIKNKSAAARTLYCDWLGLAYQIEDIP